MIKFKSFNVYGSDYHDALNRGLNELEEYINTFLIDRGITKDQILDIKTNYNTEEGDCYTPSYYDIDAVLTYWVE